jgi:hypothetical protein
LKWQDKFLKWQRTAFFSESKSEKLSFALWEHFLPVKNVVGYHSKSSASSFLDHEISYSMSEK